MVIYLCDEMLSKLARWLRIAGYDVISPQGKTDRELFNMARESERILLSRDKDLSCMKGIESLRIIADDLPLQLMEVFDGYPVSENPPGYSRCPLCNGELLHITRDGMTDYIALTIPSKVRDSQDVFLWCGQCSKPFWYGTHWSGIGKLLGTYGLNPADMDFPP